MQAVNRSFSRSLSTIGHQLKSLSVAARLLVGATVVIIVMLLVLVSLLSGRRDLAPLGLRGGMPEDTRHQVVAELEEAGIPWEFRGGDLWVARQHRHVALARLGERQIIQGDQIDFESVFRDDSPFTDRETRRQRGLVAKQNEVARAIGEMRGVLRARVVYAVPETRPGFGAAHIEPSASVFITPDGTELARATADAIARFVAGSHPGLKAGKVTVVDARTGRTVQVRADDDFDVDRHLDVTRAHERHMEEKLRSVLEYIPGVIVAVTAVVDTDRVEERRTAFDDPKQGLLRERSQETEAQNQAAAREPGVRTNATVSVGVTPQRTSSTRVTDSRTDMQPAFGNLQSHTRRAGGVARRYNTSVQIPRDYLVGLWREEQGETGGDPDAAALSAMLDRFRVRVAEGVRTLVTLGDAESGAVGTVFVDVYSPVSAETVLAGWSAGLASGPGGIGSALAPEGMVRMIVLGGLAAVSLFLMFMVVRRANRAEALPTAEELVGMAPPVAGGADELIGEADEGTAAMEGVEIDESRVRRQQMLDQINALASGTPEEAAMLVRRWVRTDEP